MFLNILFDIGFVSCSWY